MSTNYDELKSKLDKYGQEHLLRFWNELNDEEKKELTESINEIDFEQLDELIKSIDKDEDTRKNIEQAEYIPFPKEEEDFYLLKEAGVTDIKGSPSFYEKMREKGENLLSNGKVAAFVVAGGQGSRLGYDAPKGFFPIGPVTEKSLFQIYFEKLKALNKKHSTEIPFLIMTSEMTHNDTIDFMKKHNYFGYNKDKVHIFQQGKMPAVDRNGKILMAEKHKPFFSPNGHGGSVFALKDSGMLDKLIKEGIEHIFYFQVDNVLVRMCEPYFLGCHIDKENELSIKVIEKAYPEEKLGVYVINNGKPFIIEYSDLSDEKRYAKDESEKYAGKLKYRLGSHAIHILSLAFIKSFTSRYKNLPFHKANKKVPHINEKGEYIEPEDKNGIKFEMFIFDILPYSTKERVTPVEGIREREFAPLKNKSGKDSIETAKNLFMEDCARILNIVGIKNIPRNGEGKLKHNIEISPYYRLFKEELKEKVKGISLDKDTYIGDE